MNKDFVFGGFICSVIIAGVFWLISSAIFRSDVALIIFFSVILICMLIVHKIANYAYQEDKRNRARQEEIRREVEERKLKYELEIKEKYGASDIDIKNPFTITEKYIMRVFFAKKIILINDEEYKFSDIVNCFVIEKEVPGMKMETVQTQTVNNTGIAGRAIVGGLIAGPTGAIIGGVTAKNKEKTEYKLVSTYKINYCVNIITKNENNPCVTIEIRDKLSLANEIKSVVDCVTQYTT